MLKTLRKNDTACTPYVATKNWSLSNVDNNDLLLAEDGDPIANEILLYNYTSVETASFCNIALEDQENDLVRYREGIKKSGLFPANSEPQNIDGTYKRVVYSQVRTMFYNNYRDPTKLWGMEKIDFDTSGTRKFLSDYIKLYDIPTSIFGENLVKKSIILVDYSLDDYYTITDDGLCNLFAGPNLFSRKQVLGDFSNNFLDGFSDICDSYFISGSNPTTTTTTTTTTSTTSTTTTSTTTTTTTTPSTTTTTTTTTTSTTTPAPCPPPAAIPEISVRQVEIPDILQFLTSPLDQAVYNPNTDTIFAVRGGTIFEYTSDTAVEITSSQYDSSGMSPACLTYDPNVNKIFASCWNNYNIVGRDQKNHLNQTYTDYIQKRYMYSINTSTLSASIAVDVLRNWGGWNGEHTNKPNTSLGIGSLKYVPENKMINVALSYTDNPYYMNMLRFSGSNPSGSYYDEGYLSNGGFPSDLESYFLPTGSQVRDIVWAGDKESGVTEGVRFAGPGGTYVFLDNMGTFNLWDHSPAGMAIHTASGHMWISGFSSSFMQSGFWPVEVSDLTASKCIILKFKISDITLGFYGTHRTASLVASIDPGLPYFHNYHMRYNSYNDRIYVPGYGDNSVIVINPIDNSYVIKTGFDLPLDVVFTPSKSFAVQHGDIGLKEII